MSLGLVLVAILLMSLSGIFGSVFRGRPALNQPLATALSVVAAVLGLIGAGTGLAQAAGTSWVVPFTVIGIRPVLGIDALSSFFLVPVFLMGALGSIYGLEYWPQRRHGRTGRSLRLFWGLLAGGMALVMVCRDGLTFLIAWEVMALSAYFLITTEDHRRACREAGWIYLIATHMGMLALMGMFALWRRATGGDQLVPVAPGMISAAVSNAIFVLALIGFGLKAGMMPLHFWLPSAHANAPSHVSAMLSGVMLKVGIYGLVRMLSLLPAPPPAWGGLILLLASVSALLGVVFAIGQHDLKRLLAYHSVENIGIILMGLGLAMLGRSLHRPAWVVLGLAGCLLHVWNHSLFKSLLFFGAGSVLHSTHTRQLDRLGGLARSMPRTALLFVIGAVAICGLPPLNGFVSELLIYVGLLQGIASPQAGGAAVGLVALVAPVLAMVGALAVACFVKVYGTAFLGVARTQTAARAQEVPRSMLGSAAVLAALCILIGLVPIVVAPILDAAIGTWTSATRLSPIPVRSLLPLGTISVVGVALVVLVVAIGVLLRRRAAPSSAAAVTSAATWGCGYALPTSRMQYTASSFAASIVGLFGWVLRPRTHSPAVTGAFPQPTRMHSHVDDAVLDRVLRPAGRKLELWFGWFHRFQQGLTQHYVLYLLLTVILMLAALVPYGVLLRRLFAF